MVSKNVLRKLSDAELERYFISGNRFTPEAVETAFEILTERGRLFSESEEISIREMILSKNKEEESRTNEEKEFWKDHITEDPSAIKLYSRNTILIIALIFGIIPGSILLFLNLITVRKYTAAILTVLIGFGFFFLQNYIISIGPHNRSFNTKYNLEIGILALGAVLLLVISVISMPKKLAYQSKSLILPIILSLFTIIMYILFKESLSGYPLISVFRLLRSF
ncbi:hypothetical protein QF023_001462 [Chryseobacterium sp. SLBN-27]|nr:hypothetical protein [Chryseobacterium sp. SLBN-27]